MSSTPSSTETMQPAEFPDAWQDERIVRGMRIQLQARRELLDAGHVPLGWKLAFGGPAALLRLRISQPLVGFLMADKVIPSGAQIPVAGWTKPAVEPELAVYLDKDVATDGNRASVEAAISGIGPAIELADVDHPSDDVEGTLARNIYQRHVVLGPSDNKNARGRLDGLRAIVFHNEDEIADTSDLIALTGEVIRNVGHVARLLSFFNEGLHAGQLVIAGSITPPIWAQTGSVVTFQLQPMRTISVSLVGVK